MAHFLEAGADRAPYAQSGRGAAFEFRKAGFERLQFIERPVVFRIGHARLVKHVVLVVPAFKLGFQLMHACGCLVGRKHLSVAAEKGGLRGGRRSRGWGSGGFAGFAGPLRFCFDGRGFFVVVK